MSVCLAKVDVAKDRYGCFLPSDLHKAYAPVKECVGSAFSKIFSNINTTFLSRTSIVGIHVKPVQNNFDTCFQYEVHVKAGDKLLQIKVNNKLLDSLGRDDIYLVSSRVRAIVGAKRNLTLLN